MFKNILVIVLCLFCMSSSNAAEKLENQHLKQTMIKERTLSIIKPDAVAANIIGKIDEKIERVGLKIIAMKMLHLTRHQAEKFYEIHRERPFFNDLVTFMSSGPVVVQVLEGDNAVVKNREIMGATNPNDAAPGTIRKEFAKSIDANCVHGSDSIENAKNEIVFFFSDSEIFSH